MPDRKKGTTPPDLAWANDTRRKHHHHHAAASTPTSNPSTPTQALALNPPFDPRIRSIGSPLNLGSSLKRGWIQEVDGTNSVNFMLNPASLDLSFTEDPNAKSSAQAPDSEDVMSPDYVSTSSTGISLYYDRTYELFSKPTSERNFANTFGCFADIAAWLTYLKMYESYPNSWQTTMTVRPVTRVPSYLFVGALLPLYGFVQSMNVTISHFTLNQIPQRCKIDLSYVVLPKNAEVKGPTVYGPTLGGGVSTAVQGYVQDFLGTAFPADPAHLGDAYQDVVDIFGNAEDPLMDYDQ